MVLENCEPCMTYWIKSGRNMYGYRLLARDQHINEAHMEDSRRSNGPDGYNMPIRKFARQHVPIMCRARMDDIYIDDTTVEEEEEEKKEKYELEKEKEELNEEKKEEEYFNNFSEYGKNFMAKDDVEVLQIDTKWYTKLYKAARNGDWESGKSIIKRHGDQALVARIRGDSETVLHIAAGCGSRATSFLKELVKDISPQSLEVTNSDGCTPLGIAAKVGNLEAAKILLTKNPNLLYIPCNNERFPIHNAAEYGHKEMLLYLLQVTQQGQQPDPYDHEGHGPELLRLTIKAGFYDAALLLLQRMPELATSGIFSNQSLQILAENPYTFSCWRNMGVFKPLINTFVPKIIQQQPGELYVMRDIESGVNENNKRNSCLCGQTYFLSGLKKIHQLIWGIFEMIVPLLKHIKNEKLKRHHAKKLVKVLCREAAENLNEQSDAALLFKMPLLVAAENGIHEIVKEILNSFPDAIWCGGGNSSEVFRLAIEKRHHKVYNLLYEMDDLHINIVRQSKENEENILHLAGNLAPSDRLRIVSGAALQMQRELQWFKEIESLVQPSYKSMRNMYGSTPREVFSDSHQQLMEDGEKWMRDTATSCTVVATLIATVVFAAAITVPGGNDGGSGKPMLGSEKAFIIFGVADALSLFTSSASVLMFLSVLTSRYAEDDFLRALPSRLIIGLLTLFISVASMMVAFSSTLYLMFGYEKRWILGSVIVPSCLLVVIFASMHISLLAEMINSTYLCGIFKKRRRSKKPICFNKAE